MPNPMIQPADILALLESYPPYMKEPSAVQGRRKAIMLAVEDFDLDVFAEAVRRYCRDAENKFFPSPGEIAELCLDVVEESKPKPRAPKVYTEVAHECAEPPDLTNALGKLRVLAPYEARHVTCSVLATCPKCGISHERPHPMIELLMAEDPRLTKRWKVNAKGLFVCENCEGA